MESDFALARILPHVHKEAGESCTVVLERDEEIAKLKDKFRKYKEEQEKQLQTLRNSNESLKRAKKDLEWGSDKLESSQMQTKTSTYTSVPQPSSQFANRLEHLKRMQAEMLYIAKGLKVQITANRGISFMKFDKENAYNILKEAEEEADEIEFDLTQQNDEMRQLCQKMVMMNQELSRYWIHRLFWRQRDYTSASVYGNLTLDHHENIVKMDGQGCSCDFYDILVNLTKLAEERDHQ